MHAVAIKKIRFVQCSSTGAYMYVLITTTGDNHITTEGVIFIMCPFSNLYIKS